MTLGDLDGLVTDLQVTAPSPMQRSRVPGWAIPAAVAAAALVLGLVVWTVVGRTPSPPAGTAPTSAAADRPTDPASTTTTTPTTTPSGPLLLHSLGGVNGLFEQIRAKFGDTRGYELSVYTDYAELVRPDSEDDRFTARYRYYAGTWEGPAKTPDSGDGTIVDLSAFDVAAVLGVIRGAPDTMGLEAENVLKVWFTVEPADDPTAPQALTVHITVSTSFGSGLIDLDAAGNVKRVKQPF